MKQTNTQTGSLHIALIGITVLCIVVAIAWRYQMRQPISADPSPDTSSYITSVPGDILSYSSVRDIAMQHHPDSSISSVAIRRLNGIYVYEILFIDKSTVRIDALSGSVVDIDAAAVSTAQKQLTDNKIPLISFEAARSTAVAYRQGGQVTAIEYAYHDGILGYGVQFDGGGRVDIDAKSGAVVVYR